MKRLQQIYHRQGVLRAPTLSKPHVMESATTQTLLRQALALSRRYLLVVPRRFRHRYVCRGLVSRDNLGQRRRGWHLEQIVGVGQPGDGHGCLYRVRLPTLENPR
jgi:hypothetical protein